MLLSPFILLPVFELKNHNVFWFCLVLPSVILNNFTGDFALHFPRKLLRDVFSFSIIRTFFIPSEVQIDASQNGFHLRSERRTGDTELI